MKILPHSVEAEQSVIGAVLIDSDSMIEVSDILKKDDFYILQNKLIYECMLELFREKSIIDIVTLTERLKAKKYLDKIDGINYLTNTTVMIPSATNVKSYADIVKRKSILRKLIRASEDIKEMSAEDDKALDDILDLAEKKIFDISQDRMGEEFIKIDSVVTDVFGNIEDLYRKGSEITGVDTGFKDLNKKLGGFHNSDLILIAARPGMGKTAFALNLVANASIKAGASVAVFSLEMSKNQLVQRMLSSISSVPLDHIIKGKIADNEWKKLIQGGKILSSAKIFIDDTPGIKISEIRSKCRKKKMEDGLDMVMIDYLQLMESDSRAESRQQEVSKISRSLKILAKELNCPVVALSQLSRNTESGKDHMPKLSDLRDSGAIEQDADIVMFIYRDEYYNKLETKKKNIADIRIAKNRHGETDDIELVWVGETQRFLDKAISH